MHGDDQELKQETTAVNAGYVPVFLEKNHNNAHKAVWLTKATVIGAIFAFVDSIDMIRDTWSVSKKNEKLLPFLVKISSNNIAHTVSSDNDTNFTSIGCSTGSITECYHYRRDKTI